MSGVSEGWNREENIRGGNSHKEPKRRKIRCLSKKLNRKILHGPFAAGMYSDVLAKDIILSSKTKLIWDENPKDVKQNCWIKDKMIWEYWVGVHGEGSLTLFKPTSCQPPWSDCSLISHTRDKVSTGAPIRAPGQGLILGNTLESRRGLNMQVISMDWQFLQQEWALGYVPGLCLFDKHWSTI